MPAKVENAVYIRSRREILEKRIVAITQTLKVEEDKLKDLHETCRHLNKSTRPEYDFYAYECPDCGKFWTTRR